MLAKRLLSKHLQGAGMGCNLYPIGTTRIEKISAEETIDIRHRVLWPNKPKQHCLVEGDDEASHFGIFSDYDLVGVASVYECDGAIRLRKLAVEKQYQGRGLGTALFKHALYQARFSGASEFWFDARENAVSFYEKFGLRIDGNRFYKSGLPYFRMSKKLNR